MLERLQRLVKTLRQGEAYYITDPKDVLYYSGFIGEGTLLLSDAHAYLFTDFRYMEAAQRCNDFTVFELGDGLEKHFPPEIKTVRLREACITLAAYKTLQARLPDIAFASDDGQISNLRMVKDEKELSLIFQAASIAESAFAETLNYVRIGVSERELAFTFESLCRKKGAEGLSFDTIVASGPNSSMPHATVTDRRLCRGDFVTFDFGCKFEGYCSDMTRTVAIGMCEEKQRAVYETVLGAQKAALAALRAGVACRAVDAVARDYISAAGYGANFGHALGHGVGMDIHEAPNVSSRSEITLQAGMVVTVEPGIYLPREFGVRIEDLVCVKADGSEVFTKFNKEMQIL